MFFSINSFSGTDCVPVYADNYSKGRKAEVSGKIESVVGDLLEVEGNSGKIIYKIKTLSDKGVLVSEFGGRGFSRDTFYRYKELVDEGGFDNLIDKSRRKPNLRNRVSEEVENATVEKAFEFPAWAGSSIK